MENVRRHATSGLSARRRTTFAWLYLPCLLYLAWPAACDTRVAPGPGADPGPAPTVSPGPAPTASPAPSPAARPEQAGDTGYRRDVERVCFAEALSGALERPDAERMFTVADWLGRNIETEEGRAFLAELARVAPADKPAFLSRAAREAGLAECPLVETWARAAGNPVTR